MQQLEILFHLLHYYNSDVPGTLKGVLMFKEKSRCCTLFFPKIQLIKGTLFLFEMNRKRFKNLWKKSLIEFSP